MSTELCFLRMDANEQFRQRLIQTLAQERKKRGLSHETVAKKAGISRQALGKIEAGQANPTMLTVFKIVSAMGMTLEAFVRKL